MCFCFVEFSVAISDGDKCNNLFEMLNVPLVGMKTNGGRWRDDTSPSLSLSISHFLSHSLDHFASLSTSLRIESSSKI